MDIVWYFTYEEDEEFQTLHPEGSSVWFYFAEWAVTSPQSYYTVKCLSFRVEFINFTVWGNSPSLTCFRTDILLLVELLVTWFLRIEDLLHVNLYKNW